MVKNLNYCFPPIHEATQEGLLAVGGDLSRDRLLSAYRQGIFPWYSEGQPILWWSPHPRTVLFPGCLKVSRSLKKTLRHSGFCITMDAAFTEVIEACSRRDKDTLETWITGDMRAAYCDLFQHGNAHSIEVWSEDCLVGGLYGVTLGRIFFGESMFSNKRDASKVALVGLDWQMQRRNFNLVDCQLPSKHLFSLGAENIDRDDFMRRLKNNIEENAADDSWHCRMPVSELI